MTDIPVPGGSLAATGKTPAAGRGQEAFESSLVLTSFAPSRGIGLIFKGYAPTITGVLTTLPSNDALTLSTFAPSAEITHSPTVSDASLLFVSQTVSITMDHRMLPASLSVNLTGELPLRVPTADNVAEPGHYGLSLRPEAPFAIDSTSSDVIKGPPVGSVAFQGQAPFAVGSLDHIRTIPEVDLTLASVAPAPVGSGVTLPATAALALSTYAPNRLLTEIELPAVGAIAFTTFAPTIFPTPLTLTTATYAPSVIEGINIPIDAGALTLTPQSVAALTPVPPPGALVLVGSAPTVAISSFFVEGSGRLISLTTEYDVLPIAAPTGL